VRLCLSPPDAEIIPDPEKQMASRRDAETQREENDEILRSFFSPPRLCVSA
jgi:hypothetical protein